MHVPRLRCLLTSSNTMTRISRINLCLLLIVCICVFNQKHLIYAQVNKNDNHAPNEIVGLVEQLNASSFQVREDATRQLIEIGPPAIQSVAEAMLVRQPEQAFRCAQILESIGMTGDENDQLKIVRVFYLLSQYGYPQLLDNTTDFRKRWKEKRRQHVIRQLRNAGIKVTSTGSVNLVVHGFIPPAELDLDFVDEPVKEARDNADRNKTINAAIQRKSKQLETESAQAASKANQKSIEDELAHPADLPPSVTPASMISAILQSSAKADIAAIEKLENRVSIASSKPNPAVSKHRELMDQVLEARAVDGGIRIIRPGENPNGSISHGHQISIDQNSQVPVLKKWLPQLENVYTFTANDATISAELISLLENRKELRNISLSQCNFDSTNLHTLGKNRNDLTITVVGKALLGVYGPTDSRTPTGEKGSTCVISEVVTGTAAEEAGILVGDTILKVEEFEISCFRDLIFELASREPGDEVRITLERSGKEKTVTVKLRPRS